MYATEVDVRRLGGFKFPVELEMTFDNGDRVHMTWDGQELWKKFTIVKPSRLVSATIDPDHKIPLDINFTNNSKTIKPETLGANKLSVRMLFWMQSLFDQPEFLNLLSFFTSF